MSRQHFTRDAQTWASYWALGYFAFLQAVPGPLMPFLRASLHLSYSVASLHFSAFALGSFLMGNIAERVSRHWGRRVAFWGGGAGMALGALLLMCSPSAIGTIAAMFLMGFLGGLLLIMVQAILSQQHARWRSVALTEANVVASIFAILASLIPGLITGVGLTWRLALLFPLAVLAVLALRYRRLQITPMASAQTEHAKTRRSESLPLRFWALWSVVLLETGVEWCIAYWGAGFLAASGITASAAASAMGAFFLAMVLGRYTGSRLARKVSSLALLAATLTLAFISFPLFWLAPTITLHVIGLFLIGLTLANVYPLTIALAASVAPEQTDRATARATAAGGLAVLIAPAMLGALADRTGIAHAFGISMPLLLAALVCALLAVRLRAPVAARA